jgi:hypothetical protein
MDARSEQAWLRFGVPGIESYPVETTRLADVVRFIQQLPDGAMAIGGLGGLVIFDGAYWQVLSGELCAGVATTPEGRTFVGTEEGIGEIVRDSAGGYRLDLLTKELNAPLTVRADHLAFARGSLVSVFGRDLIILPIDGKPRYKQLDFWCDKVFTVDDELYLIGGGPGVLNRWDWEAEAPIPEPEKMGEHATKWVFSARPRSQGGVWMRTNTNEILAFDGRKTWAFEGNPELARQRVQVQDMVEMPGGVLAVATGNRGLLQFTLDGTCLGAIDAERGLEATSVERLGYDRSGGLWFSTPSESTRSTTAHVT